MFLRKLFLAGLLIINSTFCYPMTGKPVNIPMKPYAKLDIRNGEVLRYKIASGGEDISEFKFIIKITNENNVQFAYIYHDGINYSKNERYPEQYSDYKARFLISLDNGSLYESRIGNKNNITFEVNKDKNKIIFKDKIADYEHSIVNIESKTWDGFKVQTSKSRITIKKYYPILDLGSGMVIGVRFLDITNPGLATFIIPEIVKEPLPIYFRVEGREKITLKSGTFNTLKLSIVIADSFLSQLMQSYIKETMLWMEDSDRRLVIKMNSPIGNFYLDEISNITIF